MYDQVVKCQRAGLCLSEHFLICFESQICHFATASLECDIVGLQPETLQSKYLSKSLPLTTNKYKTNSDL